MAQQGGWDQQQQGFQGQQQGGWGQQGYQQQGGWQQQPGWGQQGYQQQGGWGQQQQGFQGQQQGSATPDEYSLLKAFVKSNGNWDAFQKYCNSLTQPQQSSGEEFQKINDIWKGLDDDEITWKWIDPTATITSALNQAGKQDELVTLAPTLGLYVKKVLELFQHLEKEEKRFIRTINGMKEKIKTGKVSVRIVGETAESLDSFICWTIENGELWLETRASHWGKHLQSYTAHKMAKLLNTYSYKSEYGDSIEHKDTSVIPESLQYKKWKLSPGQLDGLNSNNYECNATNAQAILDGIISIKEKTGVKFKFDMKLHCDTPVLMMLNKDDIDSVKRNNYIADICGMIFHYLACAIKDNTIAQQFIAQNCKTGTSCVRVTHADAYHADPKWEVEYCSIYFATKFDDGDIVVLVSYLANVGDIGRDLDRLTTEQ